MVELRVGMRFFDFLLGFIVCVIYFGYRSVVF